MPTIRDRLAELDTKIMAAKEQSEVNAECNEQYRIRYKSTLGSAYRAAELRKTESTMKLMRLQQELSQKQSEVDTAKLQLDAAELTYVTLGNQEVP